MLNILKTMVDGKEEEYPIKGHLPLLRIGTEIEYLSEIHPTEGWILDTPINIKLYVSGPPTVKVKVAPGGHTEKVVTYPADVEFDFKAVKYAPKSVWFCAQTEHLLTVEIDEDPYTNKDAVITVGGSVATVAGRIKRYRDGGTTIIPTDKGEIVVPSKLRREEFKPSIDGDTLYPIGSV